jgi:PTS system N-acetylglucosamine-specific IIC component
VGGLLVSLALTSFLTGVTEPIAFSFMFLAPPLFLLHALLTGASMVIMDLLHVKLGFGFSAGLFDYVLNFTKATRPLWLLPVGAAYFAVYYGVFRFVIQRFDLKTPGREVDAPVAASLAPSGGGRGADFALALGGAANLVTIDACTTRLRLIIADHAAVDEARLKALGARGFVKPSEKVLQVVLGPIADQVAGEIRAAIGAGLVTAAPAEKPAPAVEAVRAPDPAQLERAGLLLTALGGAGNFTGLSVCSSRLRLEVKDADVVSEEALTAMGARGLVRVSPACVHVVLGPDAELTGRALGVLVAG